MIRKKRWRPSAPQRFRWAETALETQALAFARNLLVKREKKISEETLRKRLQAAARRFVKAENEAKAWRKYPENEEERCRPLHGSCALRSGHDGRHNFWEGPYAGKPYEKEVDNEY